jgi:hypothetical protein
MLFGFFVVGSGKLIDENRPLTFPLLDRQSFNLLFRVDLVDDQSGR